MPAVEMLIVSELVEALGPTQLMPGDKMFLVFATGEIAVRNRGSLVRFGDCDYFHAKKPLIDDEAEEIGRRLAEHFGIRGAANMVRAGTMEFTFGELI